jgi:hypothetical protein
VDVGPKLFSNKPIFRLPRSLMTTIDGSHGFVRWVKAKDKLKPSGCEDMT